MSRREDDDLLRRTQFSRRGEGPPAVRSYASTPDGRRELLQSWRGRGGRGYHRGANSHRGTGNIRGRGGIIGGTVATRHLEVDEKEVFNTVSPTVTDPDPTTPVPRATPSQERSAPPHYARGTFRGRGGSTRAGRGGKQEQIGTSSQAGVVGRVPLQGEAGPSTWQARGSSLALTAPVRPTPVLKSVSVEPNSPKPSPLPTTSAHPTAAPRLPSSTVPLRKSSPWAGISRSLAGRKSITDPRPIPPTPSAPDTTRPPPPLVVSTAVPSSPPSPSADETTAPQSPSPLPAASATIPTLALSVSAQEPVLPWPLPVAYTTIEDKQSHLRALHFAIPPSLRISGADGERIKRPIGWGTWTKACWIAASELDPVTGMPTRKVHHMSRERETALRERNMVHIYKLAVEPLTEHEKGVYDIPNWVTAVAIEEWRLLGMPDCRVHPFLRAADVGTQEDDDREKMGKRRRSATPPKSTVPRTLLEMQLDRKLDYIISLQAIKDRYPSRREKTEKLLHAAQLEVVRLEKEVRMEGKRAKRQK